MKNQVPRIKTLLFSAVAFAGASLPASAQDATVTNPATTPAPSTVTAPDAVPLSAPDSAAWQFGVTVPAWLVGINGNATIRGQQRDVNKSFNDLKQNLDQTFSLGLEAHKGKWGVYGGVGYMKFSNDGMGTLGVASGELKFVIADAGVSYNLIRTEEEHPFILDGTVGLRYWYTDLSLKVVGPGVSASRNLEDPMIGLRGSKYLTTKLHLDFSGDIGGFGISDNQAELDWSATGMMSYDFVKWFSLSAGYKAVGLDASKGGGINKNGMNVIFNGALIAAKFKF
jgi:hypothetical protein